MTQDLIHYPLLIDQAMRGVVREALRRASVSGLPGGHHFFITFNTAFPGVRMSDALRAKFTAEMTIVLQHQFWDFTVEDHAFGVSLSFGGAQERLHIPFAAITAFADPSVKFSLQLQPVSPPGATLPAIAGPQTYEDDDAAHTEAAGGGAEIITLDAFRKK